MKDEQVDGLLRDLPRQKATDDFTRKVMARLDEPERRFRSRRLAFGLTLAAVGLFAMASLGLWLAERSRRAAFQEEIEKIKTEHQDLKTALAEIRNRVDDKRPVLYVGGNDRVDYVLDLQRAMQAVPDGARTDALPVQYTGGSL